MSADISQSSLNLTVEERRVYGQLFQQADTERIGVVTGDVAVKFFERTKLDPAVLAQIWQIADSENRGLLTPAGFSVALRLIGHCQSGRETSAELATKPGPLPRFDAAASAPPAPSSPVASSPIAAQNSGPIRVPPLMPEKVSEFTGLFERAGARNGYLGGDASRQMFERAKLPNETLGRIWNLVDTEERGALSLTEFIIAMHLITSMKNGSLRALPQSLPSGLFDAANRRGVPPTAARSIQPQYSGSGPQRAQSPLSRPPQFATPPVSAQQTGSDWLISPPDKAKFDQVFATIDKGRTGYVTGEQAVTFFSTSGLPEDTLASIWDLADINSEGQLNRDEFAVAMYLIRQQRSKTDDRGSLPSALPPQLIPPSMRQKVMPPSQPTAPVFDNAANAPRQPQPKSAADDLFGLDALSQSQTSPQAQQASLSTASPPPAEPPAKRAFEAQPPFQAQTTGFKQFTPTSSFGQGLAQQNTGGSVQSNQQQTRSFTQSSAADDLLGDNEPDVSSRFNNDTTELANMSNQISTLRSGMSEVQSKKSGMEAEISTTSNQKRELETRLAQFRAQYEQEIREVKLLEERLNASRTETRKLQQDMGMIEGTHADLQNKHRDLTAQFEADQRENASLKERTSQLNSEINQLKMQMEKLQADARQQRGLVAINRKQLATSEAERDRVHQTLKETTDEKTRLEQEEAETARMHQEAEQARAHHESERARLQQETQEVRVRHEASKARAQEEAGRARAAQEEAEKARAEHEEAEKARMAHEEAASLQSARSMSSTSSPAMSPSGRNTNPFFAKSAGSTMSPSIFSTEYGSSQGQNAFDDFFGPTEPSSQPAPETSFGSTTSRELQEEPAVISPTEPPRVVEPPEPPEARQITSSALPLHVSALRSNSLSSSVRANAPASRAGDSEMHTPTESVNGDNERVPPTSSPMSTLTSQNLEKSQEEMQMIQTSDFEPAGVPTPSENLTSSAPGAFPGDSSIPTTPGTDESISPHPATMTHASGGAQSTIAGGLGSEFPPIRELDQNDDDSDSDEEDTGAVGLRDAVQSPRSPAVVRDAAAPISAHPTLGATDTLPVPDPNVTEVASDTDASALPTPTRDIPPPTYESTNPESNPRPAIQSPREYNELLPSREIMNSPPAEVPQSPPAALTASMMNSTGSNRVGSLHDLQRVATNASVVTAKPAPVDDFDSAFDDLSEAKEDTTEEDAFGSSQREEHEFNPTFDSPAPSHRTFSPNASIAGTGTGASNHQTTSSFDSIFGSAGISSNGPSSTSAFYDSSSSNAFPSVTNGTNPKSATSNHDWDDLFSGLDNSTTAANGADDPFELSPPSGSGEVRDGPAPTFGLSSSTTGASSSTRPSQPERIPSFSPPPGPPPSKQMPPPPTQASSTLSPTAGARPPLPARAISTGTEHDDPILKSLTSMGYPRDKALKALEQYDYNIDAAADHLARTSK